MSTNQTTQVVTSEKAVSAFKSQLQHYEADFARMMENKKIDPQTFQVYIMNLVKKNPKLLDCDRGSFFGAIFAAAELGLMPNTSQRFCDILPYNRKVKEGGKDTWVKEAQFQLGYQGIIELAWQSPEIDDLDTQIVYQDDHFEEILGANKDLIHGPGIEGQRGEPIGVYAIATLATGVKKWKYLNKATLMKFKELSQGASSKFSPWNADNDPELWMWRKTAIKQLWKELPKTGTIARAMEIDNAAEMGGNLHATEDGSYEIVESDTVKQRKAELANDAKAEKTKAAQAEMFKKSTIPGQ